MIQNGILNVVLSKANRQESHWKEICTSENLLF